MKHYTRRSHYSRTFSPLRGKDFGKAYNDSELTWIDWNLDERQRRLLAYTQSVIALRKINPVFQRQKFFQGRSIRGHEVRDIAWYSADGTEMSDEDWSHGKVRGLGLYLDGEMIGEMTSHNEPIRGEGILLLLNAHHESIKFRLPQPKDGGLWTPLLDTNQLIGEGKGLTEGTEYPLEGRALAVFRLSVPVKDEDKVDAGGNVAAEVAASVPILQMDAPPSEASGGTTLNKP